jgi:hypothetical protein
MSGGWLACSSGVKSRACSPPSPCYRLRHNFATLRRHLTNQPQRHRQVRQLKKPCRSNSAPAAMTAINTSFLNLSGAILSRIYCPTYMPSTTGNIAAVETENVKPTELAAGRHKNCQQAGGNDEIQRCFLCERLSAQSLCKRKYENKRSRHRCDGRPHIQAPIPASHALTGQLLRLQ